MPRAVTGRTAPLARPEGASAAAEAERREQLRALGYVE
jgi:hypothetical protein